MKFWHWLFGGSTPPPTAPAPDDTGLPSEADIRWARQQTEALIRQAQALDIEVDLDRLERSSR